MTSLRPADPRARRRLGMAVAASAVLSVAVYSGIEHWRGELADVAPAAAGRRLTTALKWVGGLMAVSVSVAGPYVG